jgi:aspartate aminotransferase-like enzyme
VEKVRCDRGRISSKAKSRTCHLGYAGKYDVIIAIAALEVTLRDQGYKFEMGKSVAKAVN